MLLVWLTVFMDNHRNLELEHDAALSITVILQLPSIFEDAAKP